MKIIGITIAVILGILLFVILLILLVPLRYKVRAERKSETKAKGRISWLFGIIYVKIEYVNENMSYVVRVFGYPVFSNDPKRKHKKRIRRKKKNNKNKKQTNKKQIEKKQVTDRQQEGDEKSSPALVDKQADKAEKESERKEESSVRKKEEVSQRVETRAGKQNKSSSRGNAFFEKIKKLRELPQSIKQKISDMLTMIKNLLRRTGLVKGFILNKTNRPGFNTLFGTLRKLLKHLKPKKYKVSLYFGFDDPCLTGQVLGGICAIYPQILGRIDLKPEFQRKILELTLYARGKVRILTLLIWSIQLILKKEFKDVIKELKQLKEEL
ncbi:MAG: DUF2953 domain-containing protein [bacterium]|nr:DUF2953 domain-containing protein [bacterium]